MGYYKVVQNWFTHDMTANIDEVYFPSSGYLPIRSEGALWPRVALNVRWSGVGGASATNVLELHAYDHLNTGLPKTSANGVNILALLDASAAAGVDGVGSVAMWAATSAPADMGKIIYLRKYRYSPDFHGVNAYFRWNLSGAATYTVGTVAVDLYLSSP